MAREVTVAKLKGGYIVSGGYYTVDMKAVSPYQSENVCPSETIFPDGAEGRMIIEVLERLLNSPNEFSKIKSALKMYDLL